jgi:hypothetical protein
MTGRTIVERRSDLVPAGPFIEWLEAELARSPKGAVDPITVLADRLGVDPRQVRRWRKSLDGSSVPVDEFPGASVENALHRAGLRLEDLYPDHAPEDVELEPDIFCGSCVSVVTPIKGQCPWCTPEPGHPYACVQCGHWKRDRKAMRCVPCERRRRAGVAA